MRSQKTSVNVSSLKNKAKVTSLLRVSFTAILCSISSFATYLLVTTYLSQQVSTTVGMKINSTFDWPSIILVNTHDSLRCSNRPEMEALSRAYNLTLLNKTSVNSSIRFPLPFNLSASPDFDWRNSNLSDILLQAVAIQWEKLITKCKYQQQELNGKFKVDVDCRNTSTGDSMWRAYMSNARMGFVYNLNAVPATTIMGGIQMEFNLDSMKQCEFLTYIVMLQQSLDPFYIILPTTKYFFLERGKILALRVKVEEFHTVNRRSSPCEEDITYSVAACQMRKSSEYIVKNAGCHIPAISGFLPDYPECRSLAEYDKFIVVWQKSWNNPEIVKEQENSCPVPCHVRMYQYVPEIRDFPGNNTILRLLLDPGAMYYLNIQEKLDMTRGTLNIGGTLGLFLGVSFLSGFDAVGYVCKFAIGLYKRRATIA